jgi:hypothetical protein
VRAIILPPLRGLREGEVLPSYGDGGVMGHEVDKARDPSVRFADTCTFIERSQQVARDGRSGA